MRFSSIFTSCSSYVWWVEHSDQQVLPGTGTKYRIGCIRTKFCILKIANTLTQLSVTL